MRAITPAEFVTAAGAPECISDDNIIFRSYFERFNLAVMERDFELTLSDGRLNVNVNRWPRGVVEKICAIYRAAGWDVVHHNSYAGPGCPYYAVSLMPPS
jgi:hypothetical protein